MTESNRSSKSKPKSKKEDKKPLTAVRGGSVCDAKAKGAHIIRGSNAPAICKATPGKDTRPRWHAAGK